MAALSFADARACVVREVLISRELPPIEYVPLAAALHRVLAVDLRADRDFPALDRSVRDGFAVTASDHPRTLRVSGEVRAGEAFEGTLTPDAAIEIMTGAPIPQGAEAVVMVEHVTRRGALVDVPAAPAGQFLSVRGEEARQGQVLLQAGQPLRFGSIAVVAAAGCASVPVYRQPRVAILATGDELVPVEATPLPHQIRNSNAHALAAQVLRAGGIPEILEIARDTLADTTARIERGLQADLLLLSGGVSAGKYDVVEPALAALGARFFFDRVAIQPGQPLVFGRARGKFFFGLPGNPNSTLVTFEMFARAAVELLSGRSDVTLPWVTAALAEPFRHKPGLTRFLPAWVAEGQLHPVRWKGSGDLPALARANAWMVVDAGRAEWSTGDAMPVILL